MKGPRLLRQDIIALLREGDFPGLVALAGKEPGVVNQLVKFLFDPGDLLHWRGAEGLGYVAGAFPQQVQKVISRLLYMLNEDSGSFGWLAAAALGEIGRHQISLVQEIIPMFCGFLEGDFSRASMLWGMARMAQVHPQALGETCPFIIPCLKDRQPLVRALAALCLGRMGEQGARESIKSLEADEEPVQFYDQGELQWTTVGRVAREALAALG
jgi:hypothetical protein